MHQINGVVDERERTAMHSPEQQGVHFKVVRESCIFNKACVPIFTCILVQQ